MLLIECRNVRLGYQGAPICSPLSFQIEKGDYLCIVGENGSGKTTLMKTLLNLLPPLAGEIQWGEGVSRHTLGYLSQQTVSNRDFPATAEEILLSGIQKKGLFSLWLGREQRERATDCAKKLGITNILSRPYSALSGGQQRRVLLARALCAANGILFLDEPTAGLDPAATEDFYSAVHKLNQENGVTVIMVTHDLRTAQRYATSVLQMAADPVYYLKASDYFEAMEQGGVSND